MVVQTALPEKQIQGNPLESHLRMFATSLMDRGYCKKTIQDKLYLLATLGWWFGRSKLAISQLDESLVSAFVKQKGRVHALDLPTLRQFIDHLRKREVIPHRKVVRRATSKFYTACSRRWITSTAYAISRRFSQVNIVA